MTKEELIQALQHKIDNKTKPTGSLGQLERIAMQLGLIQQTLSPKLENPAMFVFAADHGLADEGISPYPKEVTWQMAMNFMNGGAAINVFCHQHDIQIKIVDAGVDFDFPEDSPIIRAKIARGTRNMRHEPAMTTDECQKALEQGAKLVREEYEKSCNIIGFGEMGIGNTSASSLLMHRFTGYSIEECTGRGAGLQDAALDRKTILLQEVAEKYTPATPMETLAIFGGFEIAMMCGGMLEAARLGMVVMVDGFIATAAALTACQFEPEVHDNMVFCHTSDEKGHRLMLSYLKAEPVLNLGLRLGEGTGAALAYPILVSATKFINEMASFDEAGVSSK